MVNQKIKVLFNKTGMMRFVSHLDLMRLFQRGARRAALPVFITKGFSPHVKLSIQPAVKLGVEARSLEAIFKIEGWINPKEFKERLSAKLPGEIEILEAKTT